MVIPWIANCKLLDGPLEAMLSGNHLDIRIVCKREQEFGVLSLRCGAGIVVDKKGVSVYAITLMSRVVLDRNG